MTKEHHIEELYIYHHHFFFADIANRINIESQILKYLALKNTYSNKIDGNISAARPGIVEQYIIYDTSIFVLVKIKKGKFLNK